MKKNIIIILNAVVYNRGSEALIRGITKICKDNRDDCNITLVSSEPNFGNWINIENVDFYQKKINYNSKSLKRYIVALLKRINTHLCKKIITILKYSKLKNLAKGQDLVIIIGADNYDITYNMQEELNRLHKYLRKNTKAKMLLYDCSIDKRDITETLKKDIENFDYITVRESVSKKNIETIIDNEKVFYYPDPAFVMEKQETPLPEVFKKYEKVVGINASNLITNAKYSNNGEIIIKAYKNLINHILNNTDYGIVLVPHVMNNADLKTLKVIHDDFKENERVYLIDNENLNARQLKYIISNCSLYVGARTHSTIAAYSSKIPTLVLGYSVKSIGIAKDLFETDENYVLPVSNLKSEEYLVDGFKWLDKNQKEIKNKLDRVIPNYINKAEKTYELVKKCLES